MQAWRTQFKVDPLPGLIQARPIQIRYFAGRDLMDREMIPLAEIWALPDPRQLIHRQQVDGSWRYPSAQRSGRAPEDYDQIETFRNLGILVEKFGFTRDHPAVQRAAAYFFSKQTPKGDICGIYGRQYTPNYTGAILELLIKAGYLEEEPVRRGLEWLLAVRQNDGGWSVPLRTHQESRYLSLVDQPPLEPVRSRPSSHLATGCVLRAFAAHPAYRAEPAVQAAGRWLASRLIKPDFYPDRRAVEYWTRFSFPYWFTDLISALDTLSRLGFRPDQEDIRRGLIWLIDRQLPDGSWDLKLLRGKDPSLPLWMQLNICRIFRRFFGD